MILGVLSKRIAEKIASAVLAINAEAQLNAQDVAAMLEYPPDSNMGDLAFPWTLLEIRELFGACTIQAFKAERRKRAPQVGTIEEQMVKSVLGVS